MERLLRGSSKWEAFCRWIVPSALVAFLFASQTAYAQDLFSAVLPQARSVQVGTPATAFATIINNTTRNLTSCGIALATSVPASFSFFRVNSANSIVGARNERANIAAGGSQGFVFEIAATATVAPRELQLTFQCAGAAPAAIFPGVNTFFFGASTSPIPDILSIGSVLSNDGIINVPGTVAPATGIMSIAAINLAANADRNMRVVPVLSSSSIAADLFVCETNPLTGACLQTPAGSVTSRVKLRSASTVSTYTIFVRSRGGQIVFSPAESRVALRFLDTGDVIRGATSAAVRTRDWISPDADADGKWDSVEAFSADMLAEMVPNGAGLVEQLSRLQVIVQDGILLSDLTDRSIEYGRQAVLETVCLRQRLNNNAVAVNQLASALEVAIHSNADRASGIASSGRRLAGAAFLMPNVTAADCD
jgi:hypothetical protein